MSEVWVVIRSGPDEEREITHVCSNYELAAKRARGVTLLWGPADQWNQDGHRYFSKDLKYFVSLEEFILDAGSLIEPEL